MRLFRNHTPRAHKDDLKRGLEGHQDMGGNREAKGWYMRMLSSVPYMRKHR